MAGEPTDPHWFRTVLGRYPTGVCVVTGREADGSQAAMVVGSFTSVSLDPPLIAFFPDRASTSWPKIRATGRFCVNVLSADQEDLCRRFSTRGGDKFAGVATRTTPAGSPVLNGVVAWIDCELKEVHRVGDHYAVYGLVRSLDTGTAASPLLFLQGGYGRFAPSSPPAPGRSSTADEPRRPHDTNDKE